MGKVMAGLWVTALVVCLGIWGCERLNGQSTHEGTVDVPEEQNGIAAFRLTNREVSSATLALAWEISRKEPSVIRRAWVGIDSEGDAMHIGPGGSAVEETFPVDMGIAVWKEGDWLKVRTSRGWSRAEGETQKATMTGKTSVPEDAEISIGQAEEEGELQGEFKVLGEFIAKVNGKAVKKIRYVLAVGKEKEVEEKKLPDWVFEFAEDGRSR